MKILVVGGYGTFGGRLAALLADDERLTLLIAGRALGRAEAFCQNLHGRARSAPICFDRGGDIAAQLRATAPDLVVDASGPFQAYGRAPYRLAETCIALGIDYLDLADGADFVAGIAALDAAARARGVFALSGVSSFPVLTAAVVRHLARAGDTVETITAGIAPSPYAGVGINVIRAIAGYAGSPISVLRDGRAGIAHALIDSLTFTIAPPGHVPLAPIRFSLVDVPDLRVLPALWPTLKTIWIGAGPTPAILHRALGALAWLVRLKLVRSLAPLAGLFHFAINRLRWGEHRGGMFVAIGGRDAGGYAFAREWHLVAEGDDGPFIPSMAAAALVRRVLAGQRPPAGARPAICDLELADYAAAFASRRIVTGIRDAADEPARSPLFQRILGGAWPALAEPVRALHASDARQAWEGVAAVERGRSIPARLAAAIMRFPRAAASVPVRVEIRPRADAIVWRRQFGARHFASHLSAGRGRCARLLVERFGALACGIALAREGGTLHYVVRRWSVFGIPLPRRWAPAGATREFDDGGRFGFDVEIRHRFTGLIVRYKGWLAPAAAQEKAPLMTAPPTLTVCYNGACPVCRAEMERYQRIAQRAAAGGRALPLGWNDINSAPELFRLHNIDFDTAMRRLHAVDAEGRLIRGIDVFIAIWRVLPRHRWAAAIVGFPPVRAFAWLAYEGAIAPLVYRWSRRRLRLARARGAA